MTKQAEEPKDLLSVEDKAKITRIAEDGVEEMKVVKDAFNNGDTDFDGGLRLIGKIQKRMYDQASEVIMAAILRRSLKKVFEGMFGDMADLIKKADPTKK